MRQLARIARSFTFAFAGLAHLLRTQANFWVHLAAATCVAAAAVLLGLRGTELAVLILTIGLVLVLEALNTALESLVDLAAPGYHPLAKVAKDVAAAAVLLAAITAAAVGIILLLPPLLRLFSIQP